jgi:VanZ family protein
MWSERPLDWQLRWTLLVVVMLGAVLELAQSLTPTRSMEMLDWVADSLGALLVALLLRGGSHLPEPR